LVKIPFVTKTIVISADEVGKNFGVVKGKWSLIFVVRILALHFLTVPNFLIKTKQILILLVFSLWQCKLGTSKLDYLITIYTNWPMMFK
jgi:hypothetical protein